MEKYHSNSVDAIIARGSGYQALGSHFKMLEIVADAIENVGVENFDSQSLYDAAQSFTKSIDGRDMYGFSNTKRFIVNAMGVLEVDAVKKTLVRNDPNWYLVLTQP